MVADQGYISIFCLCEDYNKLAWEWYLNIGYRNQRESYFWSSYTLSCNFNILLILSFLLFALKYHDIIGAFRMWFPYPNSYVFSSLKYSLCGSHSIFLYWWVILPHLVLIDYHITGIKINTNNARTNNRMNRNIWVNVRERR